MLEHQTRRLKSKWKLTALMYTLRCAHEVVALSPEHALPVAVVWLKH